MHILKTEAIIIKRRNIGEADRILTVFTNNYGKIQIKAKGVRKITSKRSSHIELLNVATLTFYKGQRFPVLIEAQSMENFALIKQNLKKVGIAYHVCELIDGLCPENQEQQDIFFLLKNILIKLNEEEHLEKIRVRFSAGTFGTAWILVRRYSCKEFQNTPIHREYFGEKIESTANFTLLAIDTPSFNVCTKLTPQEVMIYTACMKHLDSRRQPPLLIVTLGKNRGIGITAKDIRERIPTYLSEESKINLLAAHAIYTKYQRDHKSSDAYIFFSTGGNTAGLDTQGHELPGEATLQADDFKYLFPDVPENHIIVSENSDAIDTAGDAKEVVNIIKGKGYRVVVITVGYHLNNAVTLFENYGIHIEEKFAAENIVRDLSPKFARYIERWEKTDRIRQEKRKEFIRKILLHTIDPKGKLLRLITRVTRT